MAPKATRVLLLSSDPELGARVRTALETAAPHYGSTHSLFQLEVAAHLAAGLQRLCRCNLDAVLLDSRALKEIGPHALSATAAAAAPLSVIVLADDDDETAAANWIEAGADDYLLAGEFHPKSVRRTILTSIQRQRAERQITESELGVMWRLAKAAEYRDEETGNHVIRVGCYSRLVAEALRLERTFVEKVFLTAPLHDVGKIGIPDAILRKPGKLTPAEWTMMKTHCQIGAEILRDDAKAMEVYYTWKGKDAPRRSGKQLDPLRQVACRIALSHHEWFDGTGYPFGLAGDDIPLEGRIVAVCDVYDALLSARPYKRALHEDEALAIIRSEVGSHFDPEVHRAFELRQDELRAVREDFVDETEQPVEVALTVAAMA
jgi:response regulator RpfG family c-di-GMP phosphodiesterase